jgi:membrane protein implicated in regulation of membrane protease activity
MTVLWWYWVLLGMLLLGGEVASAGGFYLLFPGLSAVFVGLLASAGAAGTFRLQLLLFGCLTVGSLLLCRHRILHWLQVEPQQPLVEALIGAIGVAHDEPLAPGAVGHVRIRGMAWPALNRSTSPLVPGARIRGVSVEGPLLHVEPDPRAL